jgi:ribulose-5-phosphate 4-epimerase/fuculose-1-phosphate aldolase
MKTSSVDATKQSRATQHSTTDSANEEQLRIDLAAAFRMAVHEDLHESISNHFSAMLPDGKHFLINPYGLHFDEITASSLVVCDLDGNVVRGNGAPSAAGKSIHAPIHRELPRAKVVFHTHQPWSTALTMIGEGKIEWALQAAVRFYGRVAYDRSYDGVALDDRVGTRVARTVGDAEVLLMGNHGVLTVGPTIAQAWDDLYFLERVCKTQILAMSTGQPLAILDHEMIQSTNVQTIYERIELDYIGQHFAAQKRRLNRAGSDYAD